MRRGQARWAGFLLTLVWMVARLALPLQPSCPHHALASLSDPSAAVLQVGTDGAGEIDGADALTAHHGHHESGHGTGAPTDRSGAPECECAAHCCGATAPQFLLSAPIAFVAWIDAPEVPKVESSRYQAVERPDVAQPPATAPPAAIG
ncbi:hypothetical protein [Gemmatimonas aurantiaca]|nr:hypothetical protein [Gemmatimonas aurantiaca]